MSQAYDIKSEAEIYPLFIPVKERVGCAIWQKDLLVPVSQRPGENLHAFSPHLGALGNPKMVPKWIVACVWYSCVKSYLVTTLISADGLRKGNGIIVRKSIPERCFCAMKKVLAVEERDGANHRRRCRHPERLPQKARPRQRPCGVSSGAEVNAATLPLRL